MRIVNPLLALTLIAVALAGCADGGQADVNEEDAKVIEKTAGLEATEDTGIIRGVVMTPTYQPIVGANVSVLGAGVSQLTDEDGVFGFQGLDPAPYILEARKLGWNATQVTVTVIANEQDVGVTKIFMEENTNQLPYAIPLEWGGYISCSNSLLAAGLATCDVPRAYTGVDLTGDDFIEEYTVGNPLPEGRMDFAQSELHWDSTQQLGNGMSFSYSGPGSGTLLDNYASANGESPLMINANKTMFDKYSVPSTYGLEDGYPLQLRIFNDGMEGTDIGRDYGDPTDGDNCVERPVLGGCTRGLGMTLDQFFTVYTHVFYGFEPDEDWRFTEHGHPVYTGE